MVLLALQDEGWKLNRTNYYQEGWLATGNIRGIVGVTFTTSHCRKNMDYPLRTNYNLRGHRSDVSAALELVIIYHIYLTISLPAAGNTGQVE